MIRRIHLYFRAVRGLELLMMLGPPLLGVLFSAPADLAEPRGLLRLLLFLAATYALAGHVYAYNGWAGLDTDRGDLNKQGDILVRGAVGRREILVLSLVLLALALAGYLALGPHLVALGLVEAGLWFAYCDPRALLKARPAAGSVVHLAAGEINFLLGYTLCGALDAKGVLVGLFFSLLFVGGHLNHEILDCESDARNGFRTNAVRFGRRAAFLASVAVFTAAHAHMVALGMAGIADALSAAVATAIYPIYLVLAAAAFRGGFDFERMRRFRASYRLLYSAFGLFTLVRLGLPLLVAP